MGIIWDLFKAVKLGEELKNPATWKNGQVLTTTIGALLYILLPYLPDNIALTTDVLDMITKAIVGVVLAVNGYVTLASSKKVGL